MSKVKLTPIEYEAPVFEEDVPKKKGKVNNWESGYGAAAAQAFAEVGNLADTGWTLGAGGLAKLFGQQLDDKYYADLNRRIASRKEWAGDDATTLGQKAAALPISLLSLPLAGLSPATTGKDFLDKGEKLSTAYKAAGIDTAGQLAGMALPMLRATNVGNKLPSLFSKNLAGRVAEGASSNVVADALTREALQGVAQQEPTKAAYANTPESLMLAGLSGGVFSALPMPTKKKPVDTSKIASNIEAKLEQEAATPGVSFDKIKERALAKEKVNKQRQAEERDAAFNKYIEDVLVRSADDPVNYSKSKPEAAADDALVARLEAAVERQNPSREPMMVTQEGQAFTNDAGVEAGRGNLDAARELVRQQSDVSTGEGMQGGGRVGSPKTVVDSGLMGTRVPEQPPIPRDTTLDLGAYTPGTGKGPQRVQGPSNLMGVPPQEVMRDTSLDLGANVPGTGVGPRRTQGPSNLMGVEPPVDTSLDLGYSTPGTGAKRGPTASESGLMGIPAEAPPDVFGSAGSVPNLRSRSSRGQGGSAPMINDLASSVVNGVKGIMQKPPKQDSVVEPTSPENIAQKTALRNKANAVGLDSIYNRVTTIEEALDPKNLGPDLNPAATQELGAGMQGALRRNSKSGPLRLMLTWVNDASNKTNAAIKQYITGKDGINVVYRKLTDEDKVAVNAVFNSLSKREQNYTAGLKDKLGLSTAAHEFLTRAYKGNSALYDVAADVSGKLGLKMFDAQDGYFASNFDYQFVGLAGKFVEVGGEKHFVITDVPNAKNRLEFTKAVEHYEKQGLVVRKLGDNGRSGFKAGDSRHRQFDEVMFLLKSMAENDMRFKDLHDDLADIQKGQNKAWKGFDVHELHKKGVGGYLGNKPWLDDLTNAKQGVESLINHMDKGFKYWNSQELMFGAKQLEGKLRDIGHTNTASYIEKYMNNFKGHSNGITANFISGKADQMTKAAGFIAAKAGIPMNENTPQFLRGVQTAASAILQNIISVPSFLTQSSQMFQFSLPEAQRIAEHFNIPSHEVATSLARAALWRTLGSALSTSDMVKPPPHIKGAYEWMKRHGMDDFNEVMLSHEVLQHPMWTATKNIAFWPTTMPETYFRPMAFMWFSDMLHKAGKTGEDLYTTAKEATDWTMTDYRVEERPLIYNKLGVLGQPASSYKVYAHNAVDQLTSRGVEGKQFPKALAVMVGLQLAMGGLLGLPFMEDMDEAFIKPVLKKSSRELLEEYVTDNEYALDGAVSAYTELDFQSRYSLANMAPDSGGEAIAGAPLSFMYKALSKGVDYLKNPTEANAMLFGKEIVPRGLSQAYQQEFMMDEEGFMLNDKGQRKYDFPRTKAMQEKSALFGIRPLAEKKQDQRDWSGKQRQAWKAERRKYLKEEMVKALNYDDQDSFNKLTKKYMAVDGDPLTAEAIRNEYKKAKMSERQRQQGTNPKSSVAIDRFLEFED